MTDLDMLKAVVDAEAAEADRWTPADAAVRGVLRILRMYQGDSGGFFQLDPSEIYDAIKDAYRLEAVWEDE